MVAVRFCVPLYSTDASDRVRVIVILTQYDHTRQGFARALRPCSKPCVSSFGLRDSGRTPRGKR